MNMSRTERRVHCIYVILFIVTTATVQIHADNDVKWTTRFEPNNFTLHMHDTRSVNVTLTGLNLSDLIETNATIKIVSNNDILEVSRQIPLNEIKDGQWSGQFNVSATFLGQAKVFVHIIRNGNVNQSPESLDVIIIREERLIDTLFTISVATLVSILYINFGAALDLRKVRAAFVRPIGPSIALFCHFLLLPVASYVLGLLLFPDNVDMQLGLFFTGVSPAGGASNVWTVILGGNIELSVAMTTTSTFAAFAMMPFWIFTLGKTIFDRGNIPVPYRQISTYAIALVIPLGIGLLIQRYCPRLARLLVRILKTCSSLLILFIVIFAIITNLYLFKLFTWEILVAGLTLPWLGYFVGWLAALLFQQEYEDRLAVAIEAGIQNTGIAIFILRFALGQPQADLTTVVPVSVAIMTPFPLMAYYLCYKGRECYRRMRDPRSIPNEAKECIESQSTSVTY